MNYLDGSCRAVSVWAPCIGPVRARVCCKPQCKAVRMETEETFFSHFSGIKAGIVLYDVPPPFRHTAREIYTSSDVEVFLLVNF